MEPLGRRFYARDTVKVARGLLGCTLARRVGGGRATLAGVITETEAYMSGDDPASHAHRGMTQRNRAMFGEVGCAYVYFTYGMHYCINAVAYGSSQDAGAVLIRGIAPTMGKCIMSDNRNSCAEKNIANGPAKLAQALGVTTSLYGTDLTRRGPLFITGRTKRPRRIICSPRVGIRRGTDLLWNFALA